MMNIRIPIFAACLGAPLAAQDAPDRGALLIRNGSDTVVIDRFVRVGDTLKGTVRVKGQPRVDYHATLGPNATVRVLLITAFTTDGASPAQRVRIEMQGDTALAETPSGTRRIPTQAGAIPMFNNALALSELFTRRARLTGGTADIPYFSVSGGVTLPTTVRPIGPDSLVFVIAAQAQHFRVDAIGRILGGVLVGTPLTFDRAGPESADGLSVTARDTSLAPKTDYSAPAGAPYTAEQVRVQGPAGVLGGTLTRPTNAQGPLPAVVTITGSGQQDRDEYIPFAGGIRLFRAVADTLSRRGIAVLRLDDRGIGASTGQASGATSADFADDIRAGIAFLRARPDIDASRIAIVGHSEGGIIAPMIASTDPKLRAVVILAGPADRGIEISMAQNRIAVGRASSLPAAERDSILRAVRTTLEKVTEPWAKFFMSYDPAPTARQVKAATLILQGETDSQVPKEQAEKLATLIRGGGNKDVTVRVFPATNHLFVDDPSGDFGNYAKLSSNRISVPMLGVLADWLVLKLK